jgi:glycerol-3-phosphate acyltransferase PlsY
MSALEVVVSYILVLALSWLAGSFPSAWLAGKLVKGIDIRTVGSGNAGATNVLRVLGWRAALPVLLLDAFKGVAAVLWISGLGGDTSAFRMVAAAGALLGHAFPPWLGFRGGKAVATGAGALCALLPQVLLPCLAVFVLGAGLSGLVSLGSILAALALVPTYLLVTPLLGLRVEWPLAVFAGAATLLVVFLHRKNLARMLRGEEKRLWGGKRGAAGKPSGGDASAAGGAPADGAAQIPAGDGHGDEK